jgi:hypothetical protein
MEDPHVDCPKILIFEPKRKNDRTLIEEPSSACSITESWYADPSLQIPATEITEPNLQKLRSEQPEPMFKDSSADNPLPSRANCRTLTLLPKLVAVRTDISLAKRANCRKLKVDPPWQKPIAET